MFSRNEKIFLSLVATIIIICAVALLKDDERIEVSPNKKLAGSPGPQRFTMYVHKINGEFRIYSEPQPLFRWYKTVNGPLQSTLWDNPKLDFGAYINCLADAVNGNINEKTAAGTSCNYIQLAPMIVDLQKPFIISTAFKIHTPLRGDYYSNGWYQRILELRSSQNPSLLICISQFENVRHTFLFECQTPKGNEMVNDIDDDESF